MTDSHDKEMPDDFSPVGETERLLNGFSGERDLSKVIDAPAVQSLLEDLSSLTGMATAILDLKGSILVATGWQDICTKFHRLHPETARYCTESDLYLTRNMKAGEHVAYKCKNGLWDMVTPLFIGGKHICNIYTGQFFYEDEPPDVNSFEAQAIRYGFDKEAYIESLLKVRCISRDKAATMMDFLVKFSKMISSLGYGNMELARAAVENERIKETLQKEMNTRYRQQQFLEALLESTEAGIVASDADGILTLFNRKSREFHGLPQEPIPSDQWAEHYDLYLPDGKTPMRKEDVPLYRALQGERVTNDEMMIIPRGGEARILLASGQLIRDKDGRKIGAVVAMHDITDRKKVEETLRASEERYRSVVENIGIGVTMISPKMEVIAQNACMQKWFPNVDVSRRPICYESFIDPPRDGLCINCPTYRTLQDGQVHEAVIETPAGDKTLFFRVLSSPIRDKDGSVIAATEMVEDVTGQHMAEEELRQHREHLEELIKERTAELEKANALLLSELTDRKRAENALKQLNEELDQRVKERTAKLEAINEELQKMNKLFIGRELRMVELKEEIATLEKEIKSLKK